MQGKIKMDYAAYEELITRFLFLANKVENCYKNEVDSLMEKFREEYGNCVDCMFID